MSMEISRLAIEVTSTGIKEASNALGGLSRSANTADKRVASLTANLARLMQTASGNVAGANALGTVWGQISQALHQANANANATARALLQVANGMNVMTGATNNTTRALREQTRAGGVFITTLKAMTTAFITYSSVKIARSILESADAWQMMTARLTVATGSLHNAKVAQEEIFEISQKMRQPLAATAQLYTRLSPAMQRMGKDSKDVRNVVEGVNLALKLSGATGGEAASAMLQLSQSFNAGRLNGQEFNSIAEAAPKLLEAIADHMGKTRGELKKLGSDGKITGAVMAEAIAKAKAAWEEDFKNLPVTLDDAMTRIKNAWAKAMGELNNDTGMNRGLVSALRTVEELIPAIRDELTAAFIGVSRWVETNKSHIAEVWGQVKGLVDDVWQIGSALGFVAGQAVGAGEDFSVIGFAIYSVRLALAGVQDGLTLVGALILKAGSYVFEALIVPVSNFLPDAIRKVINLFSWLVEMLAAGAKWAGFDNLAAGLDSIAATGRNASQFIKEVQEGFAGVGIRMGEMGDAAIQMLSDGNGAVSRLLNEEKQITLEMEKQKKLVYDESKNRPKEKEPVDEKKLKAAQQAHEKAMKGANAELEKQVNGYREMLASLEQLQKYGLEGDKRTTAQKEEVKLRLAIAQATDEQAKAVLNAALAYNLSIQEEERKRTSLEEMLRAQEKYGKEVENRIEQEIKEAVELERKVATYGKAKGEIERLALAEERLNLIGMQNAGATEEQIAQQQRLIDAMVRRQEAAQRLGDLETLSELEKRLDPSKAEKFGNAMAESFGKAGKAMTGLIKALENMEKREAKFAKDRAAAAKWRTEDAGKFARLTAKLDKEEAESRIRSYGDMTGAAKNFFDEGSKGYKALEAAEKAFRIFEMAMAMQSFMEKSGLLTAFTGMFVASKATEATAEAASVGAHVTAEAAKQGANATTALTGALALPFPANIPAYATVAAMLAALGVMVGGKGGGGAGAFDLKAHQAKQHTGTVLGDEDAKSDSIRRSLERMRENSNIGLTYTSEMAASLRNIDQKMGGLTASVARVGGLRTGRNFGIQTGSHSSGGFLGLFGKTTTREIVDTGLKLTGKMAELAIQQFVDVQETKVKSGFLGIGASTKTSNYRQYQGVDGGLIEAIGSIFADVTNTIAFAGESLGYAGDTIRERLSNFMIDTEVSLKGLNGADLEAALNSMFSAMADDMAKMVIPQFAEFQRAGEGYFETLVRVTSGVEKARNALTALGVSMVGVWDIQNKTGEIDAEVVRVSLMYKEAGTSLANIIRLLDGSMEELIQSYRELTRLRDAMETVGLGSNLTLDMIRGAGGVSELSDAFNSYFDGFFTQQERAAISMSKLTMEFTRLGITVPQSKEAFKALVTQLVNGNEASQELAGRVLSLSGEWIDAMEAADEVSADGIGAARDALAEAYEREADSLQQTIDKMRDFAKSMKEFRDGLIMSDLSTKSEMEKYQTALLRYNDVSAKALAGDQEAIEQYRGVAEELLRFSRSVNASGQAYTADFERVLQESEALQQFAEAQADVATESLNTLKAQVEVLIDIDESVKTVAEAIADLHALMVAAGMEIPTPAINGSHAAGLANVPYDGYVAELHKDERVLTAAQNRDYSTYLTGSKSNEELVAEIKALRQEVQALKEEQRDQTQLLVNSNYDANALAAQTVVQGTKEAATDSAYVQRATIGLN